MMSVTATNDRHSRQLWLDFDTELRPMDERYYHVGLPSSVDTVVENSAEGCGLHLLRSPTLVANQEFGAEQTRLRYCTMTVSAAAGELRPR